MKLESAIGVIMKGFTRDGGYSSGDPKTHPATLYPGLFNRKDAITRQPVECPKRKSGRVFEDLLRIRWKSWWNSVRVELFLIPPEYPNPDRSKS